MFERGDRVEISTREGFWRVGSVSAVGRSWVAVTMDHMPLRRVYRGRFSFIALLAIENGVWRDLAMDLEAEIRHVPSFLQSGSRMMVNHKMVTHHDGSGFRKA